MDIHFHTVLASEFSYSLTLKPLICVWWVPQETKGVPRDRNKKLGLPFMHDVLKVASQKIPSLVSISNYDIKYDS
ncbi:MAG: hypothetical protein QXO16_07560, partial [Archaeoglobaceae archaeon]